MKDIYDKIVVVCKAVADKTTRFGAEYDVNDHISMLKVIYTYIYPYLYF